MLDDKNTTFKMSLKEELRGTTASPEASCVSVKSNTSIVMPPNISDVDVTSDLRKLNNHKETSPEASCVSMKSNTSIVMPPNIRDGDVTSDPRLNIHKPASPNPSCVSVKRTTSIVMPPNISDGAVTSDLGKKNNLIQSQSRCGVSKSRPTEDIDCSPCRKRCRWGSSSTGSAHAITTADQQENPGILEKPLHDELQRVKDQHKTSMKNKYERLFEGVKLQENQTLLNRIYTQLYIIEGESEGVNEEHEVLQMEKTARTEPSQHTPVYCNDIFKASAGAGHEEKIKKEKAQIKTVLTKGIAGIGKTVSVQKFILDWAEGKDHQDVDFMFVLPFRELNLIRDHKYSLHTLLLAFHHELEDLEPKIYEQCRVVFIFDGLDESRITLNFSDEEKVCAVTESSSVAVLMRSLLKGDLLPSALIWITSRPAAAHQIPSRYIDRLTEIQGFTEPQKEEYFRKRISDEHQASRIISHIRRARSLQIMCHIPVFCWISSTVLQKLLEEDVRAEIPQTLTEMYIHFLLIQINTRKQKYEERDPEKLLQANRGVILKLAELAFRELMKGNVMFYEKDLIESGIDVTDASVYSGICTEIFKEESVIQQRIVYSFIHLSFQEFLAAFCVFHCHLTKKRKLLRVMFDRGYSDDEDESDGDESEYSYDQHLQAVSENSLNDLLRSAVDKTVESSTGHLDLFLRFLLGISLESNQRLFQELLPHTEKSSKNIREITQYIKDMIKTGEHLSAERSINLFLCLLEVKDQTLAREIQEFVKSDKHSEEYLSPAHCSAISYMIEMSEEPLEELDSNKFNTSAEGGLRLIPAVRNCRRALLQRCNLTAQSCESLSSALQSSNCVLRELDLSNNDLQDSGVEKLSDGLKSQHCKLEILRLQSCNVTVQCCESLSSALQSSNCVLRELELSNNDLQDSGVEKLSDGLKSPNCKLDTLRLSGCMVTEEGCGFLSSALTSNPSHLRELDLSYNHPGDSGVKLLSQQLEDPNYTLHTLNLDHGGEKRITAGLHKYACFLTLDPNTAHPELKLSEENRELTRVREKQPYPDHPDRFDHYTNVLSRESVCGRCYWEIERSGDVDISVAYKSIRRKGDGQKCVLGQNVQSWALICYNGKFYFRHNKIQNELSVKPLSSRVGVFVDHSAGTLIFYNISEDTTRVIHSVQTTFTEPLYAGFWVESGSSVKLC